MGSSYLKIQAKAPQASVPPITTPKIVKTHFRRWLRGLGHRMQQILSNVSVDTEVVTNTCSGNVQMINHSHVAPRCGRRLIASFAQLSKGFQMSHHSAGTELSVKSYRRAKSGISRLCAPVSQLAKGFQMSRHSAGSELSVKSYTRAKSGNLETLRTCISASPRCGRRLIANFAPLSKGIQMSHHSAVSKLSVKSYRRAKSGNLETLRTCISGARNPGIRLIASFAQLSKGIQMSHHSAVSELSVKSYTRAKSGNLETLRTCISGSPAIWSPVDSSFCSAQQGLSNEPSLSRIRAERKKLQVAPRCGRRLIASFAQLSKGIQMSHHSAVSELSVKSYRRAKSGNLETLRTCISASPAMWSPVDS
ncbi:hypothetical protein Ddc_19814 [Ditylenchus destructor]|nr:hypothetical protein Ddc_19814 [Ditylenchus destructor]